MAALATIAGVTELGDWVGDSILEGSLEYKRAVLCLRLASALVRKESGQTWADDAGALVTSVPDEAVMVTLYCASRVYDNRNAQTRSGIDDLSESWKVDESGAYLTASEKRMLAPLRPGNTGGLGTVSTTRAELPDTSISWVPTTTPGVYFPWY
jgi:hypothetical protein